MELVRKILEAGEEFPDTSGNLFDNKIEGYTDKQIDHHLNIMSDAGYIILAEPSASFRLTWSGHNFLDDLRRDNFIVE
jgi:Hypothetical protein (DUF2513)